jgi:hypothetical protein
MAHQIDELIEKIKELEEEIEVEFQKKREDIHFFGGTPQGLTKLGRQRGPYIPAQPGI